MSARKKKQVGTRISEDRARSVARWLQDLDAVTKALDEIRAGTGWDIVNFGYGAAYSEGRAMHRAIGPLNLSAEAWQSMLEDGQKALREVLEEYGVAFDKPVLAEAMAK